MAHLQMPGQEEGCILGRTRIVNGLRWSLVGFRRKVNLHKLCWLRPAFLSIRIIIGSVHHWYRLSSLLSVIVWDERRITLERCHIRRKLSVSGLAINRGQVRTLRERNVNTGLAAIQR
jgi:hypothetical protein